MVLRWVVDQVTEGGAVEKLARDESSRVEAGQEDELLPGEPRRQSPSEVMQS